MFGLSDDDRAGRTLGCGDGPTSFNAEATAAGHALVSCDPIDSFAAQETRRRVEETYETVLSQLRLHPAGFVWDVFRNPDDPGRHRLADMHRFLADLDEGKEAGRYIAASLPTPPFTDGGFRRALVSHLLFLYSDRLDEAFQVESALEWLRVAREVRIFSLVTLERRRSPYVEPSPSDLEAAGHAIEVLGVPYESQRAEAQAGRLMMRAYRRGDGGAGRLAWPILPSRTP
jgi:hypothetical protein